MAEVLTIDEIESRFVSEWVLVGDPETDEAFHVLRGTILCHGPDRDAVYRKAVELRPKESAILYTGKMPENTAIVL
jgi:hypothetical protein